MGNKDKGKLGGKKKASLPPPSDYDLKASLAALWKSGALQSSNVERTRTEVKIGSVNVNLLSTPETASETSSQLSDKYVTEQFVQSLVNDLRADQKTSSNQLLEVFNQKIDNLKTKIENVKDKSLSSSAFWTGICIVLALLSFFLYDVYEPKQQIEGLKEKVEKQGDRMKEIEDNIKSMNDSISLIKKEVRNLQKPKKK